MRIIYAGPASELREIVDLNTKDNLGISVSVASIYASEEQKKITSPNVLWTKLEPVISSDFLNLWPTLEWVISPTTGTGHVDIAELDRRGIRFMSLRDCPDITAKITSTAEFTLGLIINVWRKILLAHEDNRSIPVSKKRNDYFSYQLKDKVLGIIGFGRVGRQLANYCFALGMKVVYFDPFLASTQEVTNNEFVATEKLDNLLALADVVALTASVKSSVPIMGEREFQLMRESAIFVNTARGSLVDEVALSKALESGSIMGAGIDVLANEDSTFGSLYSPLEDMKQRFNGNLVITPHIAGASRDALTIANLGLFRKLLTEFSV
jgi:D-3-phosphoglycerate dehydrogenase